MSTSTLRYAPQFDFGSDDDNGQVPDWCENHFEREMMNFMQQSSKIAVQQNNEFFHNAMKRCKDHAKKMLGSRCTFWNKRKQCYSCPYQRVFGQKLCEYHLGYEKRKPQMQEEQKLKNDWFKEQKRLGLLTSTASSSKKNSNPDLLARMNNLRTSSPPSSPLPRPTGMTNNNSNNQTSQSFVFAPATKDQNVDVTGGIEEMDRSD